MIKRFTGLATAAALTGGLLSGCGSAPPPMERPNGSIEHVLNNIDYAKTVGELTLHQALHVSLPELAAKPEQVYLWNYTDARIPPRQFRAIVHLLGETIADSGNKYRFPIQSGRDKPGYVEDSTLVMGNIDKEHDILVVPAGTPAPPDFDPADSETMDLFDAGASQSVSVVYQHAGSGHREGFLSDHALGTEACQSLVSAIGDPHPKIDPIRGDRETQESFCNTMGDTITAIYAGTGYVTYRRQQRFSQGSVTNDATGQVYWIKDFAVPRPQYESMADELHHRAA